MSNTDHSSAAASGPHRQDGDQSATGGDGDSRTQPKKPTLLGRLRAALTNRGPSTIRADLTEALEGGGTLLPGSFSANERALLQNVLKLRELRVDDVMVPRADIEALDADDNIGELLATFRDAGHSRLPVYEETMDHIIGFVHIKDALGRISDPVSAAPTNGNGQSNGNGNGKAEQTVKLQSAALRRKVRSQNLIRKLLFVPPSMPVGDLLQQMQATRLHMAIVVDEYGGTDGLVTIEDLLESVVGDIEDEHDDDDGPLVRKVDDNTFIADGRVELSELQEALGADFDPSDYVEEVDTLGGLLFHLVGRVPVRGEVISRFKGYEFEIVSADARRIRRVRIMRRKRVARARPVAKAEPAVPADPQS